MPRVAGVVNCGSPTACGSLTTFYASRLVPLALCILLLPAAVHGGEASEPNIPVVINEILADNGTAGRDPQNEYDDWIELYNAGDSPVDIGGMYLTDDLSVRTKWRIPSNTPADTTIAPHGYLLIWADGDTADAGLHAGFRLSADGEQIGLVAADGTTQIDGFSFGQQARDTSYGRYPDGDPNLQLLTPPTPGAPNIITYQGVAEQPQASPASCLYTTPITITLTTPTPGATIYYTFDGTDPFSVGRGRALGTTYSGPIPISRTATLKTVAWRPGWRQSPTRTERYIFIGPEVRDFSSPLPIAVVDTMGKGISRPQTLAYGYFFNTNELGRAVIAEEPDFAGRVGINIRGKSSEGFSKHQYHLETWDEHNKDKSVSILGFPADSDWVLQGPYSDKSLMRNVLAYRWSNDIGRYAVRTRFIELFLNANDDTVAMSDYVGVYVLMEKIKLGPDRVDVGEPPAGTAISGGYIIKKDKTEGDDVLFSTSRGQTLVYNDPNGFDLTQQEKDWIRNFVNAFEAALYGSNFTDPVKGYAKFIDVGSFIDHHIIVETAKNVDGFRLSTYMHIDHAGILHMGPVWDYDLSLGNAAGYWNDGWLSSGWYFSHLGDADYPYWRRLFQDPEFKIRYADRWFELRRGLFATNRMMKVIEGYATLLNEPQARNFQRWAILGIYLWPNWFIAKTWREEIDWIKGWLTNRLMWMDSQIATEFAPAPPSFSARGGHVTPGLELTMSSASGTIYYTLDGSDPRSSGVPAATSATIRLVLENAPKRVLVPTGLVADAWRGGAAFDDSAWILASGGPGGVGFERASGYESYITCDVGPQMYNIQTSCYVRIAFPFQGNPTDVTAMTLRVRYDDGFIAYLNGIEIARRKFSGVPAWNSVGDMINDDVAAVNFEDIPIANFAQVIKQGDNILALHALNQSAASSDFLISVELTADVPGQQKTVGTKKYASPVPITQTTRIKARALSGSKWSALNEAVFAVGPVAQSLRISELMYHPAESGNPDDPNTEFIELTNIGTESINLNLAKFAHGVEFTFPSYELAPGSYCLVVRNTAAFQARYGVVLPVVGEYTGSLNNAGERIELLDAAGTIIHDFPFQDDWFDITDGLGFSLTVKDPGTADPNAYDDKDLWRPSARAGGSPGADDSGQVPALGAVVINELLANSQGAGPDWIELYNTTDQPIDIGGWFLSDDANNLSKYEMAAGTRIAADDYIVLYENRHFASLADPGCHEPFGLSANGETLYLHSGSGGVLSGYSRQKKFEASEAGVSLGRYQKSTGTYNFVAQSKPTPGAANAAPLVGPVVIHEILYHPDTPADAEYVELLNIGSEPVTLYDADREAPWRFSADAGVEFLFPTNPPVTLAAGEYLLLVKDTGVFNSKYASPAGVQILTWSLGNLADSQDKLQLSKPGGTTGEGVRQWICVDRVIYSDGLHPEAFAGNADPWPTQADGQGSSLSRTAAAAYGNDPDNWHAATPSPGGAIAFTRHDPRHNR